MEGQVLGPYRIERELGSGGMGSVYAAVVEGRAKGLAIGTRVAVKVLHPHLLKTPGYFKRFLREAEIGRSVRHANVVRTFDCDVSDGRHYLAMEYVEGQTLRELLGEFGTVPEELCRHIGHEMARGLAAIHAAGAIHRDVKPENVLITVDHVVKVMDLGVARLAEESLRLSQTGGFVGSLHYAAPEAFDLRGARVDGRADLHAVGLVLYELASGRCPYLADDVPQTIQRVLTAEPRRLGELDPQLSPFFEEVVHCLLAKDRDARFASAEELAAVLASGEDATWWRRRATDIRALTRRPPRRVRMPRATAVYGRDVELAQLRELYDRARAGDGQVVLLEGEAGIGKSRLADELIARLQDDGEDVNFLFGSHPPGGAATAAGGFATAYREHFGDDGCAAYLGATPVLVPAFDALLRGETTPEGTEPLTKDSLQTCFVNATRALADERPTIVLIDDLHFAPDEGRALFTALAMAAAAHRVLLIGTTRPGVSEEWIAEVAHLDQASHIVLSRLGPKHLAALLAESLKSKRLALDLAGQIGEKSDGNPFFVFEILSGLREGQFITRREDGTWVGTRVIEDIRIPSSVLELVNARVADLTEEERDLLDVAACCGFEFDSTLAGDALGAARIPTLKRFAHLERKHRLVRCVGELFVFDHHQVQEALYAALPPPLAREYHFALGQALEARTQAAESDADTLGGALCVQLCEHFFRGTAPVRAKRYVEAALTHLENGYLRAQAADLAERALGTEGLLTGEQRAHVLLRLTNFLDALGHRERQLEASMEAEAIAVGNGDRKLQSKAARIVGNFYFMTSRYPQARECLQRALALARQLEHRVEETKATTNLGVVLRFEGHLEEAQTHYERALALSRQTGNRLSEIMAVGNLGSVHGARGRFAEALECYGHALRFARELGNRQSEVRALSNLGVTYALQGDQDEALAHYRSALDLAREIGERRSESLAVTNLGNLLWSEGRTQDAREHIERGITLSREIGQRGVEARSLGDLGLVFWSQGRLDEARELVVRHLRMARETGERESEAVALHNLGNVLTTTGDRDEGLARLTEALALAREVGVPQLAARTELLLGARLADAGHTDDARAHLVGARDNAESHGFPNVIVVSRCRLANLPGGDPADAVDAVAAFVAHEGRLNHVFHREARYLLWRATGDDTHLVAAKRLLDEALENAPPDCRESMRTKLPLHRDILAAWDDRFGEERSELRRLPRVE